MTNYQEGIMHTTGILGLTVVVAFAGGCAEGPPYGIPVGQSVWNSGVRAISITSDGGLAGPMQSQECPHGAVEYSLSFESKKLESWLCTGGSTQYQVVVVTQADLDNLRPDLENLRVSDRDRCGADKDQSEIRLTVDGGVQEFRDSFYGCLDDPRPMLDYQAVDQVRDRLQELAERRVISRP